MVPDPDDLHTTFDCVVGQRDPDVRVLEAHAARVTRALVMGAWAPPVDSLRALCGPAANRAGYWLSLAAAWASGPVAADLRRRADTLTPCANGGGFYPGEAPTGITGDALARRWGLAAGAHPAALRHAMGTYERPA